jgi:hypothetical protein
MKFFTSLLFVIIVFQVQAQRFKWTTSAGYVGVANGYLGAIDLAIDSQGNSYTLDYANAPQQCQGITNDGFNGQHIYLYKFNSIGELQFILPIGENNVPLGIEVDQDDNVYVLLFNIGSQFFVDETEILNPQAFQNYLVKLDPQGDLIWSHNTGFSNQYASMLKCANDGVYFQSGNVSIGFLNSAGESLFSITADSYSSPTSSTGLVFNGADTGSDGSMVFAALSYGSVTYDEFVLTSPSNQFLQNSLLFLKTDAELNLDWARFVRDVRAPDRKNVPVAIDGDDNIYACVEAADTLVMGTDTIFNIASTWTGGIIKMNADGEGLWAKELISTGTTTAWAITNSHDDNGVYITGGFSGTTEFGDVSFFSSNTKSFAVRVLPNGDFTNAFEFADIQGVEALSINFDSNNRYFVSGQLFATDVATFNCIPTDSNRGLFLAVFTEEPAIVPQPSIVVSGSTLTASPDFGGDIQWYLNNEIILNANDQTYVALETGVYSVEYSYPDGCVGTASSDTTSVTVTSIVNAEKLGLSIYPIPASNTLNISSPKNEMATVYDVVGNVISTFRLPAGISSLNLNEYANGIYFLKTATRTVKFSVER